MAVRAHRSWRSFVAAGLLACAAAWPATAAETPPMRRAVEHLLAIQTPDGLFRYEFDFLKSAHTDRDNIVRQAGTTYGLAEYFAHARDAAIAKPLQAALDRLDALSRPFGAGRLVTAGGDLDKAPTGATALAMTAEVLYFRTSGDARFAESREAWFRGLLALRGPRGGFLKAPGSDEESPYFNGEAWLALATYAATPGLTRRADAHLPAIDESLMARYARKPNLSFFHWGVMAADARYRTTRDARFAAFAIDQARTYVEKLQPRLRKQVNACYALEGLIPARTLLAAGPRPDARLAQRLTRRIDAELKKSLGFQIGTGQDVLALGGGATLHSPHLKGFAGAFVSGLHRPTIRIDFTQHCLSAMVKAVRAGFRLSR